MTQPWLSGSLWRRATIYAFVYMSLSLLTEIGLLTLGLRIPEDNAKIAAVLLTLVPVLAAWLTGFRTLPMLGAVSIVVVILTAVLSVNFGTPGILAPIIIRFSSGFVAAALVLGIMRRKQEAGDGTDL